MFKNIFQIQTQNSSGEWTTATKSNGETFNFETASEAENFMNIAYPTHCGCMDRINRRVVSCGNSPLNIEIAQAMQDNV